MSESSSSESPSSGESAVEQPADTPESAGADDTRARFREALERKRERHTPGFGHGAADPKSQGAHGAAGGKRVFRRKSG